VETFALTSHCCSVLEAIRSRSLLLAVATVHHDLLPPSPRRSLFRNFASGVRRIREYPCTVLRRHWNYVFLGVYFLFCSRPICQPVYFRSTFVPLLIFNFGKYVFRKQRRRSNFGLSGTARCGPGAETINTSGHLGPSGKLTWTFQGQPSEPTLKPTFVRRTTVTCLSYEPWYTGCRPLVEAAVHNCQKKKARPLRGREREGRQP
jgi:hypothetical protein